MKSCVVVSPQDRTPSHKQETVAKRSSKTYAVKSLPTCDTHRPPQEGPLHTIAARPTLYGSADAFKSLVSAGCSNNDSHKDITTINAFIKHIISNFSATNYNIIQWPKE